MKCAAILLFLVIVQVCSSFGRIKHMQRNAVVKSIRMAGEVNDAVLEKSKFLTYASAAKIRAEHGTPIYVYDEASLRSQGEKALAFPNAFGLKVRFAMKSCPNAAIVQLFNNMGINFDASSGYEVTRAMRAGIAAASISLSSQELPANFKQLIEGNQPLTFKAKYIVSYLNLTQPP